MRVLSKVLISFLTLVLVLIFPSQTFAASSVLDQYEYVPTSGADAGYWLIKVHTVKQTFKPTKNKLDKVYVYLNGNGSSATVNMVIKDVGGNTVEGGSMAATAPSVAESPAGAGGSWILYDFSTDLSVTSEAIYQIILTTTSSTAYWRIDKTPDYTRGNAVVDGVVKNTDPNKQNFGFLTYGYDAAAPAPPAADPPAAPPAPTETSEPVANSTTPTTENKSDAPATETTATVTQTSAPTVATTSAKTTSKATTSATKTKGIFQNPVVLVLVATLVVLLGGGLVYYLKKRNKVKPANISTETSDNSSNK